MFSVYCSGGLWGQGQHTFLSSKPEIRQLKFWSRVGFLTRVENLWSGYKRVIFNMQHERYSAGRTDVWLLVASPECDSSGVGAGISELLSFLTNRCFIKLAAFENSLIWAHKTACFATPWRFYCLFQAAMEKLEGKNINKICPSVQVNDLCVKPIGTYRTILLHDLLVKNIKNISQVIRRTAV